MLFFAQTVNTCGSMVAGVAVRFRSYWDRASFLLLAASSLHHPLPGNLLLLCLLQFRRRICWSWSRTLCSRCRRCVLPARHLSLHTMSAVAQKSSPFEGIKFINIFFCVFLFSCVCVGGAGGGGGDYFAFEGHSHSNLIDKIFNNFSKCFYSYF